jgi:HNH endonuclease
MAAVYVSRLEVASRARYCCEDCGYPEAASSTPMEIDHIIPEAKGGPTPLDNLALCCRSCNLHKHVKTEAVDPVTGEIVVLFNPRAQAWPEHFMLDRDTGEIRSLSPIGRASIEALVLNSVHATATRRLLIWLRLI